MLLHISSTNDFLSYTVLETPKVQKFHRLCWFKFFSFFTFSWTPGVHCSDQKWPKIFLWILGCYLYDIDPLKYAETSMFKNYWQFIILYPWTPGVHCSVHFSSSLIMLKMSENSILWMIYSKNLEYFRLISIFGVSIISLVTIF